MSLHAIDYHTTTGNCIFQQSADAPIPANHTRLLASDWAHLDVWEEVPEVYGLPSVDVGSGDNPEPPEPVEIVTASRRLLKQGVVVKYEQERDALPRPEVDPLPGAKAEALAKLASLRYDREVGGFDYLGKRVMSDRESQSKIGDLALGIQFSVDAFTVAWKCYGGEWLYLDKAGALGLIAAGFAHVGGLFNREATFAGRIRAATTVEEVQAILAEF